MPAAIPVLIRRRELQIGSHVLPYFLHTFAREEHRRDYWGTVKSVVRQWGDAVELLACEGDTAYLPFALDDNDCGVLQATREGMEIRRAVLDVAYSGYNVNLDDLTDFMFSTPDKYGEPQALDRYPTDALINGFRNAQIVQGFNDRVLAWFNLRRRPESA